MQSDERLFQRSAFQRPGMIWRVVRQRQVSVRNTQREIPTLGLTLVDPPYLVEALTRIARFERFDARSKEWRAINCPERVASTYLARAGKWQLPLLLAAISTPTLRPDGSVLQTPGYDEATALWYDPCGVKYLEVPAEPTELQARDALAQLQQVVGDFPFESETDQAVALAMMLTAVVRPSLPSAPLGAITAPTMASGKTLLADVIAILATGVSAPVMQYPSSDEEAAKTALSVLLAGDPVVLIDNIERPLQGDWLCSVLTAESYSARLLGRSEQAKVGTTQTWLATGNQLVIAGDLRTRTLLCRINPQMEHPEDRVFSGDLRVTVARERPRLVTACLTLLRAYQQHGRPVKHPPWGRFEQWSSMVRDPLLWLGLPDPCESVRLLERDDPYRNEQLQVLDAWRASFGEEPKTARDVILAASQAERETLRDALRDVCREPGGDLSSKRLGKWLTKYEGRIVDGLQVVRAGQDRNKTVLWRVQEPHHAI